MTNDEQTTACGAVSRLDAMHYSPSAIAEMRACEDALLHKDFRDCPAALERLLADDFEEVSSRGQVASRQSVINWLLHKDPAARWQFSDLRVLQLAPHLRLVRYKARQVLPRPSTGHGALHSSLWCFEQSLGCWQLRFHQASKIER